jgi:CheY-like chemotaxis protein
MSLPLFRRPGSVSLLGDDVDFLQIVSNGLRRYWHTSLFHQPQLLLRHLKQEQPLWETDAWIQQQIVRRWSGPNVSLASELIEYWSKHTGRFTLTRVCIVDQTMPRATGLQVIRHLEGRNGLRVLLTGGADHSIAVAAFNEGLIDRYAQKQTAGLVPHIVDLVRELQDRSDPRLDQVWRATLSPGQGIALRRPGVARSLAEYLRPRFAEYVLIGRPFGVLGLSASGKLGWVP